MASAMDAVPAPRNVLVRFRLGRIFGRAGAVQEQRAVLADALDAVETITEPGGRIELPWRWKQSFDDAD